MVLLTAGGMAACSAASSSSPAPSTPRATPRTLTATPETARSTSSGTATQGTAAAMLETLRVKGRAPKTGYDRDNFGQAWADVDHNGCDTRNDILHRDLTAVTTRPGTRDCIVTSGTLQDPYTATTIRFVRGEKTSTAVQIDHVVALSDAWQTGAQQLGAERRRELANDPLNLLAADGPANEQKSDGDAATWLPANKAFRCQYVARQVAVKHAYKLWVTPGEKSAIAEVLSGCTGQKVPTATSPQVTWTPKATPPKATVPKAPAPKPTKAATTAATAAPTRARTSAPRRAAAPRTTSTEATTDAGSGSDAYYQNCSAARAAGVAPLHRGDPGYSTKLDRDGDGVACE
ncbi:hypothetical protein JS278_02736 [Acidipropionibacterium virtanenii]|uniref:Excalibur calcium-binding domain-containing protein n=2 Tax=Acidipropionibacterium virtanenii TaxID=2057246 RepID=A0A344UX73_9ACTN|nr:hypothetical protein JS278_02736 [Acidipropionibacterium virtanenii]